MNKVNLAEKLSLFADHWSPKIVGEVNDLDVKLAKVKGDFVWHQHDEEDELFLVLKGKLVIEFRNGKVELSEGEFYVVPKGTEHKPFAAEEVHLMLLEKKTVKHTGDVVDALTVKEFQRL